MGSSACHCFNLTIVNLSQREPRVSAMEYVQRANQLKNIPHFDKEIPIKVEQRQVGDNLTTRFEAQKCEPVFCIPGISEFCFNICLLRGHNMKGSNEVISYKEKIVPGTV